jgi:hypothetical protein
VLRHPVGEHLAQPHPGALVDGGQPGEVLTDGEGESDRRRTQVGGGGPAGQMVGHRWRRWQGEPHPVAYDVRPGGVVAEPLAAGADQAAEERRAAGEGVDLDDPDQRPDERLLGGDRSRVVADHPQPHRQLAEGAAAGQGLQQRRVDQEDQQQRADQGDVLQGPVGVRAGDDRREEHPDAHDAEGDHVEHTGGDPRADAGRGQVEGDGLTGDEVVLGQHRELR